MAMITSCQTSQSPTPVVYSVPSESTSGPEPVIKATPEEVLETASNIPDWCNILPTEIDHVYACGEAKSERLNIARKRAVLDAKRQMADIINGRISSVMREFVTKTDIENELLYLKGSIPGPKNSEILVKKSVKNINKLTIGEKIKAAEDAKKTPDKKKKK